MNDFKHRIMIVDDSLSDLHMVVSCLKDHYNLVTANNGTDALVMLEKTKVDVILLDVNMPSMDGYQVCSKIRETNSQVKIIFLSAHDGLEEILKGYTAGGNDYITKPFSPDILLRKLATTIQTILSYELLEEAKQSVTDAFMTAVTSMGDLGIVIEFFRKSYKATTSAELAVLLLQSINSYELQACIQLRSRYNTHNYTDGTELSQLETTLLDRIAKMQDRIMENGTRMFINYSKISVFIKNMPTTDDAKMGRLRDTLALLIEGTNEKQLSIEKEQDMISMLEESNKANVHILNETENALSFIKAVHNELKHSNVSLMESTVEKIQSSFLSMGLTDTQEAFLVNIMHNSQFEATRIFDESAELENQIEIILSKLNLS